MNRSKSENSHGFFSRKAAPPPNGMKLQEKEQNQDEKHIGKLLQPKYKRCLLAQELKPQGQ